MAKPGDTRKSPSGATYIWTGRAWVPQPKLKAQQIALQQQIKKANTKGSWLEEWWNAAGPTSGQNKPANAERSWKSRFATSGTVSGAMAKTDKPASSAKGAPRRGFTGATSADVGRASKPVLLGGAGKKKDSSSSAKTSASNGKPSRSSGGASSRSSSSAPSRAGGGRKPSVSQSNTEWVKKGTMVNGVEVKKGYLAQKGKPEKRVTANVRMVKGNVAGYKAGSTAQYKAGRRTKKK